MVTEQLYYCKRCGCISREDTDDEKKCYYCKYELQPVPDEYLNEDFKLVFKTKELRQEFIDQYIKSSPEFDQKLMDREKEYRAKTSADIRSAMAAWDGKEMWNQWGVHCPYCNCTIITRINDMNRSIWFADAAVIGKQFQCMKCRAFF